MSSHGPTPADTAAGSGAAGRRALLAALCANLAIAAAKCAAWLATGSAVMLAEAAHSLADTSKQLFLFVGRWRSRRHPDPHHPLGYGPEHYFWAFVVAILLFPLGAVWAVVESLGQLLEPEPLVHTGWAAGVLVAALAFEALSLRVAVRAARAVEPRRSLWSFVRRSRDPDVPAVLLEDSGAVLGAALGLAFLGAAAAGDPRWDAVGGLAVAVLLLVIAAVLCVEFKSLLIGESALPEQREAIARALAEHPAVRSVQSLRTLHLAPDELLVLARISVDAQLTAEEGERLASALRGVVAEVLPLRAIVHVETQADRAGPGPH